MNCKLCAFNNNNGECIVFNPKPDDCWAGCYTIEDLDKRYNDMILYNVGSITGASGEYTMLAKRLKRRMNGDKT